MGDVLVLKRFAELFSLPFVDHETNDHDDATEAGSLFLHGLLAQLFDFVKLLDSLVLGQVDEQLDIRDVGGCWVLHFFLHFLGEVKCWKDVANSLPKLLSTKFSSLKLANSLEVLLDKDVASQDPDNIVNIEHL